VYGGGRYGIATRIERVTSAETSGKRATAQAFIFLASSNMSTDLAS